MQYPNEQVYDESYTDAIYTNELIPIRSTVGPNDILTYESNHIPNRYIVPTYYARPNPAHRKSAIFPEHYRLPSYFPYPGRSALYYL